MSWLLKANNIEASIGMYTILHDVSMAIKQGEAVALLGRNGAGKTTFLKTVMNLVETRKGSLELAGESIVGKPTHKIARMGIGYVPEDYGIFDELTVEENLRVAMWQEDEATLQRLHEVLELFPDLKVAYKRLAKTLSGGQRQMLSISRAMVNENQMILIDEPSKGLAPVVIEKLAYALREIREKTTVLLVEQNFAMACAVADKYFIISEGRTVDGGNMKALMKDEALQQQHLGVM